MKSGYGLALLASSAALSFAVPASADTAAASAPASDPGAAPTSQGSQVQEIVVTAEKRTQSLQDVPVAVSVISMQSAAAMGVTDVSSIELAVPGLQFPREFNGTTPTLRGVGTNVGIGSAESVVAMYIDDVYVASPAATTFSFNNVSQVEVLKGPQGTLYGRNAEGGVVDIKTRDPSAAPSADISLGYANYDTYSGSLYANDALTSTLFADLAVSFNDQVQGWGKNLYNDRPAFRDDDEAARTKVLWKPDDLTSVTFTADFSRSVYNEGIAMAPIPGSLFPNGQTYQGFYNVDENPEGQTDTRQEGASVKADRDLGFADLIFISGYRAVQSHNIADEDQTVADSQTFNYDDDRRSWTEELRLVSENWKNIHWIAGLFYFDDLSDLSPFVLTGSAVPAPFTSLTESFQVHTQSYAGFGQLTYDLPAGFHLTLGGRYTYDKVFTKGTEALDDAIVADDTGQVFQDHDFTYKVNLAKNFTKDIMVYAGYSTGFKGGTFNTASLFSTPVEPEHLGDIEAGLKAELFEHKLRLDLAYYHYDYNNMQVSTLISVDGRTSEILQNAASATNDGFEADFEAHPTDALTLRGGIEAMHARFESFPDATISVPLPAGGNTTVSGSAAGNALPHSPDFTSNLTAEYRWVFAPGEALFALDYYYNSGFAWDVDNRLKQNPYNIVNTSLTWRFADRAWSVRFWGKNITGTKYSIYTTANVVGDEETPAPPATFGVTVSRRF